MASSDTNTHKALTNDVEVKKQIGESQDELEAVLTGIWANLLGIERVTIDDNLLLLGGESLAATQIASRIKDRYDVNVSIRSILIGTVAEVAMEIRSLVKSGAST